MCLFLFHVQSRGVSESSMINNNNNFMIYKISNEKCKCEQKTNKNKMELV